MKHLTPIIVAMAMIGIAKASDAPLRYLHSINPDGYHEIVADEIARPFYIYVRLPVDYEESDKRYPVIYLLDGGFTYPMLSSYFRLLAFDEPMPEAILVGISYGAEGFDGGNYRGADFTAPAPEIAYFGGAPVFQRFLKTELIPMIAERYRTDEEKRILYGQSLGGQFVVYSAMTDPDLFWGRIANNPAFHQNLSFFIDIEPAAPTSDTHLVVTRASEEAARFRDYSDQWVQHWTKAQRAPFPITIVDMPGERHAAATPVAFRAGMRVLFPADDNPQD